MVENDIVREHLERIADLEAENKRLREMIERRINAVLPPSPMTQAELDVTDALLEGKEQGP